MDYKGGSYNANDEEAYLAKSHMKAKKVMGKTTGHKAKDNYGSRDGEDNMLYANRGPNSPDDKKLAEQAMPNDRMYSYLQ